MKKLERRSAVVMQKDFVKNIRHSSLVAIEQVKVHKKASSAFLPSKSKLAPHLAVVKQAGKQAHTLVQWAGAGGGGGGEHVGRPDFNIKIVDSVCPSLSAIPDSFWTDVFWAEPFDTIVSVSKIRYFCLKVSYQYRIGIDIPGSRKYQYCISIKIF